MHRTHCHPSTAKHLKGKKGFMSSFKGVSRLPLRARRRLYCRLQMWMWRRRRAKCRLGMLKARKRAGGRGGVISASPCLGVKLATQLQKNQRKLPTYHTPSREHSQVKLCEPVSLSEHTSTDTNVSAGNDCQKSQDKDTLVHSSATSDPLKLPNTVKPPLSPDSGERGLITTHSKEPRKREPARRLEADGLSSGQLTSVSPGQATKGHADDHTLASKKTDVSLKQLKKDIHEFLDEFYRKYGSYIPLHNRDVWKHVKRRFNCDLSDRKDIIYLEVIKYRTAAVQKAVSPFRVVYGKHTLNMDDLSTLADQNWLNDQVINMYGDLIMESAHKKVHFLNSFFHRQLMTKGYDGVKRWTKQVDLFSKTFLLVPIHLEVHWCLVTADIAKKKICIYDSQGDPLHKLARNIVKYLMAEAKEKKQTAFENGWAVSFDEQIPQQTNENDCGVFVLEYCRCLALAKPLRFTQKDIPKIRKRIYKELCDCKLHEQG